MHDPSFLAVEIHAPIPMYSRWKSRSARKGIKRPLVRRRTNTENLGERVYPWWTLKGYEPRIGTWCFDWPTLIEVWHDEPNGADSGTVCGYGRSPADQRRRHAVWLWQHRAHLRWKLIPYLRVKRWLTDRCEDCGRRFRWKEARFGTGWDAPGVLHDGCHRVRHLEGSVVDLARYVRGIADETTSWRVRHYWIDNLADYWRERVEWNLLTVDQVVGSDAPDLDQGSAS